MLRRIRSFLSHPVLCSLVVSLLLTLLVDILSRHSLPAALAALLRQPTVFLYNWLFILPLVSLSGLFRRRSFALTALSLPWLCLATVNFVLQSFRATPLSAVDFRLIFSVIHIIQIYLSVPQILLIAAGIILVVLLLLLLFRHSAQLTRCVRPSLVLTTAALVLLAVFTPLLLRLGILSDSYSNLNLAYRSYGFPYCFTLSVIDRGISEPEDYSEETIDEVLEEIDESEDMEIPREEIPEAETPVNVIFLQLESFLDAKELNGVTFSSDPVPYFTELKAECPSGFLTVPTLGAGTVNTEFEIITQMSLNYFGAGEYPYISVLQNKTCETVAYDLKEDGYFCTAIHNNTATFYDRNLVFANLGFDSFISEEYMQDLTYTPVGWARDAVLPGEILRSLRTSEGPDLIYTISVQPHGKYPTEPEEDTDWPIRIIGGFSEEEAAEKTAYEYYVNQLYEVDTMLRQLTDALSDYEEPVLLVLYGDHLPNFELEDADVRSGDLFLTEYVIWSNYGLTAEDCDLYAYQLSSHVLELLGKDTGILTKLHQSRAENADYQEELELLEYDMLYGEMNAWNGENPYKPTELRMGYGTIRITSVRRLGESIFVSGLEFNESSVIFYDDRPVDTMLINGNTLMTQEPLPEEGTVVTVHQVADDGTDLSSTDGLFAASNEE